MTTKYILLITIGIIVSINSFLAGLVYEFNKDAKKSLRIMLSSLTFFFGILIELIELMLIFLRFLTKKY
jgi:hypothetical protein